MRPHGFFQWSVRILCAGLAVLLAVLLVRYQRGERAHTAHISELRREAERYEARLKEIRNELDAAKQAADGTSKTGRMMLAFQPGKTDDLEMIALLSETYGFSPVIVLDAAGDRAQTLLQGALERGWEVVFTAADFREDGPARAAALRERVPEENAALDTGMFLLREAYENDENLEALAAAGFGGSISYYAHAAFAQTHPDHLMMRYSYLKDANFAVQKRLSQLSGGAEALMFVFDLTAEDLTQAVVERFLATICAYARENDTPITTVTQTAEAIRQNRIDTASGQAAYEALAAERQAEIDELNAKLDEIYGKWKEGDPT